MPEHEIRYLISDSEECSLCMAYFIEGLPDELKIVKSNIEGVIEDEVR